MGIDLSPAQLSYILIQNKEPFHQEKEEMLKAGLAHSSYLNADDTPEESLNYAFEQEIGWKALKILESNENKSFKDIDSWESFLTKKNITSERDRKIAPKGALIRSAFEKGLNPNLIVISDAERQFEIFCHGLCWVHEERHYRKLIPFSEDERRELEYVRSEIWDFYEALKEYKKNPTTFWQKELEGRFDQIFGRTYKSMQINSLFTNSRSRKDGLLVVLKFPFVPLHNNDCERDIREYAKRRKISGSTRGEIGRKARDTFTSIKKTCRKLNLSFNEYLKDRLLETKGIPPIKDLIAKKARVIFGSS
jgi:hypothetical protein